MTFFINYDLQFSDALTISRLALNLFFKKFYKPKENPIPLINNNDMFNFIYSGYSGGQTEVYIPYGENLYYVDVNSLYPFVSLNDLAGINYTYIEDYSDKGLDLDSLFGFFHAIVFKNEQISINNHNYLGILPLKTNKGLIFPYGNFKGIWFSEELKLAKSLGYEIKVIKGYNFNRVESVFKDYVNYLYENKKKAKGANRTLYKSLLKRISDYYSFC